MNDLGKAGSNAHALSGVSLGYAFTERISAGVSGHSPRVTLPGSLDRKGGSLGVGLHAQWQGGNARNRWYLRGAVAANTQGIERTRKVMDYTEAGSGNSRIKGWEASLELGRTHALNRAASCATTAACAAATCAWPAIPRTTQPSLHLCRRFLPPDHRLCRRHLLQTPVAQADLVAQRRARTGSFQPRPSRRRPGRARRQTRHRFGLHPYPRAPVQHRVLCAEP